MAGKVFFSVTMSLDGFMAPEAVPVEDVFSPEGQNDPRVQRWMTKWSELQAWAFPLRFFRENLKLGEGIVDARAAPVTTHDRRAEAGGEHPLGQPMAGVTHGRVRALALTGGEAVERDGEAVDPCACHLPASESGHRSSPPVRTCSVT